MLYNNIFEITYLRNIEKLFPDIHIHKYDSQLIKIYSILYNNSRVSAVFFNQIQFKIVKTTNDIHLSDI